MTQPTSSLPDFDVEVVPAVACIADNRSITQTPPRKSLCVNAHVFRRACTLGRDRPNALECGDNVSLLGNQDCDCCAHMASWLAASKSVGPLLGPRLGI